LELGESYVAANGFGHEEWLFNFDWLLSGFDTADQTAYRYGFLQPIYKHRRKYVGETFSILVYAVDPSQTTKAVAVIENAYVPNDEELNWVLERTRQNGWLDLMRQQLRELGVPEGPLTAPAPATIANIRFLPENVTFCNPMVPLAPPHKTTRIHRYQLLNWDDGFLLPRARSDRVPPRQVENHGDTRDRSEGTRTRAAQPSTVYDPQHAKLQNRLRSFLCSIYGENAVKMEREFVDLRLIENGMTTFIEIKMESTAKKCVRSALGQLVEYAHYPNLKKANKLLVVGDVDPSDDDATYLRFLRDTYQLPLYYARWSWEPPELGPST
jgi:hypothetical protein